MGEQGSVVVGIDVGTECVKALVLDADHTILGRSVVPTRGYFQERAREAMNSALDEAQIAEAELGGICATGFGKASIPFATLTSGDTACHALGSFFHFAQPICVVDIGGREPKVIHVDAEGCPTEIHTLRRCAVGIGTFLMFAARHLDVHPTQLEELAAAVDKPAAIGSYCSVFASSEILLRLRDGESRETVALGCIRSIAERVVEIGGFVEPLKVTGGVVEYFPGVVQAIADITQFTAEAIPEPIMTGALGAALKVQRTVATGVGEDC
jgi:predicted CoA-substrate-specific enzyme activase